MVGAGAAALARCAIAGREVPVTAHSGIDAAEAIKSRMFRDWAAAVGRDPRLDVRGVHLQSVDMFGQRVGFLKLVADVSVGGQRVPGVVFMRGGSVAVLVVLECEGEEHTVLVRQPRVPVGSSDVPEIPAGMMDASGRFAGVAASELREECGLLISEEELVDLTGLSHGAAGFPGLLPSPGGCDEFVRLMLFRGRLPPDRLAELRGRRCGLREEGELITLEVLPLRDLWRATPDAKALAALCLFDRLRAEGLLPPWP